MCMRHRCRVVILNLKKMVRSSLVAQWVKDPVLSLLWLRLLLQQVQSLALELPHAEGVVKKKKEREREREREKGHSHKEPSLDFVFS